MCLLEGLTLPPKTTAQNITLALETIYAKPKHTVAFQDANYVTSKTVPKYAVTMNHYTASCETNHHMFAVAVPNRKIVKRNTHITQHIELMQNICTH